MGMLLWEEKDSCCKTGLVIGLVQHVGTTSSPGTQLVAGAVLRIPRRSRRKAARVVPPLALRAKQAELALFVAKSDTQQRIVGIVQALPHAACAGRLAILRRLVGIAQVLEALLLVSLAHPKLRFP